MLEIFKTSKTNKTSRTSKTFDTQPRMVLWSQSPNGLKK